MGKQTVSENKAKIQRVLVGLGIESSMAVVDEWRMVLHESGKCSNIEDAIDLLKACVQRADDDGQHIQRPSESGKWIRKVLMEREEKNKPTAIIRNTNVSLSQIADEANERDARDPERIRRFQIWWDALIQLEKENETFADPFHAKMRSFAADDLRRGRIRDNSERYVHGRIANLNQSINAKANAKNIDQQPQALSA